MHEYELVGLTLLDTLAALRMFPAETKRVIHASERLDSLLEGLAKTYDEAQTGG